jgi:hypothetical protein
LQPPKIAIVEQSTDHVLRDLLRARVVKFVAGREYEPVIEPVNSCRHAGDDKRRSFDHRGTGEAAVRITIFQPKERHISNLAPGISGRKASSCPAVGCAFIPVLLEQLRQFSEIERHLPRLVYRQARQSCVASRFDDARSRPRRRMNVPRSSQLFRLQQKIFAKT